MSGRAWTWGDWRVDRDSAMTVSCFGRGVVARTVLPKDGGCMEAIANARLIAAAPDLFDALDDAINYLAVYAATVKDAKASALLDRCTAALSKATGGAP